LQPSSPEDTPDPTTAPEHPSPRPPLIDTDDAQNVDRSLMSSASSVNSDHKSDSNVTRMGKVAIIHDIGAVTCVQPSTNRFAWLTGGRSFEAMLYFLYTGEIKFARFNSDPRQELSAQTRTGDWSTGRLPSPSAKSIYRLADKVTRLFCVPCPPG
jgi:hypothetical protein